MQPEGPPPEGALPGTLVVRAQDVGHLRTWLGEPDVVTGEGAIWAR